MEEVIAGILVYVASKAFDAALAKVGKRREQKRLGESALLAHDHAPSHQIIHVNVTVRGPNHKLDDLSKLMDARQVQEALAYAKGRREAIDGTLEGADDPGGRCAEALRSHHQRLLFAAATAASRQGDIEAGRAFWQRARDLGPIDPEWHRQAAATLFNIELKHELRHLMAKMDEESDAYRRSIPLLAYLDEDWASVDRLLANAQSADLLLMRVQARLQIIDPKDIAAVERTAELLHQTDDDVVLTLINVTRARLTFELLQIVIKGYTPLGYNRRPLIDDLIRCISVAMKSTKPDSKLRAQVLLYLDAAAALLRDDELGKWFRNSIEALPERIRSSLLPLRDPALTLDNIDALKASGHISAAWAAILSVQLHRDSMRPEEVKRTLHEALFTAVDERQRAHALRLLAQHLRKANRIDKVLKLIESTPLRPADRWLLRAENLPAGKTPLDLADEVKAFPLDVDVIERLAQSSLSTVEFTSPKDPTPDAAVLDRAEKAVDWTTRLVQVLPSRSSRFLHAQALFAARRYSDLLTASRNLDPIYAEHAAEIEAWALVGLDRRAKATDLLIAASADHPDPERLVIIASGLLMTEGRPAQAEKLLEPHVTAKSQNPDILASYAVAIRAQDPGSRNVASRAFDLFARAYDLRPNPRIAGEAWRAARAAGRASEAGRFFKAMIADAPVQVVQAKDDLHQAMQAVNDNRAVLIEGGSEYLAELFRMNRERSSWLDKLLSAHALAYTDFFRHSGRSWELWTHWIQQFEMRSSDGETSLREFSVLADWPSGHEYRHGAGDIELFVDQTAILTLGVLGPGTAEQLLAALGTCYVQAGTIEEMRRDFVRIKEELLSSDAIRYTEAARFLRRTRGSTASYSKEVASAAPNDPDLGPCRVDLGVAVVYNTFYVTDLDNSQDWPDDAKQLRLSSATLLASLNTAGEVTAGKARNAAKKHPNAFGGWNTATPRPIPRFIVFDEYSILDWVDTGLADVLGNRVKVGPWAWMHISGEVGKHEAMELAHELLQGTIDVLHAALDEGTVVEIKEATNGETHEDTDAILDEGASRIESLWAGALRALRTAQAHGLQLWADDRFYPLLLRLGGPTAMGPDIQAIRDPFVAWAENTPPISTTELLGRLSSAELLTPDVAQDAAAKLFVQGYRMAHPLLLAHALRQFPAPVATPLTPPFQELVSAITEIPRYLPGTFEVFFKNRGGSIRATSMSMAARFIVGIWEAEGLSIDQRCALANAFLEAVEHVFEEASPNATSARSDRTPIVFWQRVAYALQMMSAQDERQIELRYTALCWLGKAAASRAEQRKDIVRVLEDNVLVSLKYAHKALKKSSEGAYLQQPIATLLALTFVPFTNTGLIDVLDPLLRRTVGTLVRLKRDGRMDVRYYATADRDGTPLNVSEEETEQWAAEVLGRAAAGDPICVQCINATDIAFTYTRPAPKEWTDAGFPANERIATDERCALFSLLWADPPGLRELIVRCIIYHLSALDPALAYRILRVEDDLLCDNTERAREARDWLAVDLLQSGYFDLQRDLAHAVQRFRQYDPEELIQFVGWIGEEATHALANRPQTTHVMQIGPLLAPMGHFFGRALLTDGYDDGALVLERAKQIINAGSKPDEDIPNLSKLAEWLADKASVAETDDDPFVAAWALRVVLLVLSKTNQNPELNIDGRVIQASDWATGYLAAALAAKMEQHSELEQRMTDRRRLASAALHLAAYSCSGDKHVQAYSQEDDPLAIWLNRVWLLATKLQVALVGLRGGLTNAAEAATKAMQDLGLPTPDARVPDAFDPFAFGLGGDDIGIALTLTAMLKVVHQLGETSEPPLWWTDTVRRRAEALADAGSERALTGDEGLDNRLGLIAPLCVRILAQQLTMALPS